MFSSRTGNRVGQVLPALAAFIGAFVLVAGVVLPTAVRAQDLDVYVSAVATTTPDGTQTAPFPTIEQALAVVPTGGTVHVDNSGAYTVSSTITLNKAGVSLVGTELPVVHVSGGSVAFMVSATGITINGFSIQKDDKTTQAIIQIASSDTSILNNTISGQFVIGDAEVSRAMVIQGSLTGLTIQGNTFVGLRQPAYVSGVTTGTVSGNHTARTKGWVLEQGNLDFSNNTWGQGTDANVYDIAIIPSVSSTYYTDIPALSAANNGAFIEDQRTSPATLSVVYVDEAVVASGDGTQRSPKKTLAEAVSRVVTGGTIVLASNVTTTAQTDIAKALTIDGADHKVTAAFSGGSVLSITKSNVTIKNLVEDGGTQGTVPTTGNRGINIYKATGVTLDTVTASNNTKNGIVVNGSTVIVNNITTSGNGWEAIDVDLGSGVMTPASLTVNGVSQHSESKAAIRIDDITKATSVTDTNNQYGATTVGNVRDYYFNAKKVTTTVATQETTTTDTVTVTADIPAGTVVTGSVAWDGVLEAPAAASASVSVSGFSSFVTSAISIGSSLSDLTFDKAAKLTFTGRAGNLIGWYNHAGTFTEITATCSDNTQATNDGLASGADCKLDVGGDLVVWTKHFSTFVTYTQVPFINGPGSSGGSSSSGSGIVTTTTATPTVTTAAPVGRVLGAETFTFASDLGLGRSGDDVMELQKVLITSGYLKIAAPTGYFGPLTKAAVKLYQGAHGIVTTGFVGPLTRGALNQPAPVALTAEQKMANLEKIQELLKQVLDLQTKLTALSK